MKRLASTMLALSLVTAVGSASAQDYDSGNDRYDRRHDSQLPGASYAYARVLDVRPVVGNGYGAYRTSSSQRCYSRQDGYAGDGRYGDDYGRNDGYYGRNDGGDPQDAYGRDDYRNDGYADRDYRGNSTGRTVATVVGGVVGAVLGSQVGGGSARYATSALGSMVGGIAGQKVYENSVRNRYPRNGTVTVCDPVPDDRYHDDRYGTSGSGVNAYDVTYEYAGREYTSRTSYHPGDRIRVRVDVRPE